MQDTESGLVSSYRLVARKPTTTDKSKISILPNNGVRPARCATTREKPEYSREEENVGRDAQRKSQERYSRRLQSVAAYHDRQHAIVRLDDLISNTLPSESRPLRSGLDARPPDRSIVTTRQMYIPLGRSPRACLGSDRSCALIQTEG